MKPKTSLRISVTRAPLLFLAAGAALLPAVADANRATGLSAKDYTDYTAVVVKLEKTAAFKVNKTDDGRLAIVIDDCSVKPENVKLSKRVGVVEKVSSSAKNGKTYVYITLGKNAKSYDGKALKSPPQILFKVYKKIGKKAPPETLVEKPTLPKGDFPTSSKGHDPDRSPNVVDTIVIDVGHGGRFSGAEGPKGTDEKDVNLAISLRLAQLLKEKLACRVFMIRTDDSHVFMRDRTGLANAVNADLFISVHNNAVLNAKASGTETFFLSEARSDWERAATMAENQDYMAENPNVTADAGTLNFILSMLAQNEFLQESSELAHAVQGNMVEALGLRDRGVKQAPFYVLVGTEMPSILVECAFISNPAEEELLTDAEWQSKCARAIFDGVKAYKETYEARMKKGR